MNKYYEIRFCTEKREDKEWIIHIEAKNKKEALRIAAQKWINDKKLSSMHRFRIQARLLKDNEEFLYHYFKNS
jgi:hypothetical protein